MDIKNFVEYIRESSKKGRLLTKTELGKGPLNLKDEKLQNILEKLKKDEGNSDIAVLIGERESYLYSKNFLSDGYRDLLFNLKERKTEDVFIEIIRSESKIYPRPTSIEIFKLPPFSKIKLDIEAIIEKILNNENTDIKILVASNGAKYLYSEKYITLEHAKGLCEWIEIGQFQNP